MDHQLEDLHLQLELADGDGDLIPMLLDYDIVLRLNDDGTGYAGFELVHYPTNEILLYEEFKDGVD
jgi:hypothetical protein